MVVVDMVTTTTYSKRYEGKTPELVSFGCGNASSHTPGLCQFNPVQGDFQVARWFVWHNLAASFRSNSAALS